jgi:hypothetical protein
MITWSHQHSLKLFNTFLKEYSIISKVTEAKNISLRSLHIKVLKNQPRKWARANKSKQAW